MWKRQVILAKKTKYFSRRRFDKRGKKGYNSGKNKKIGDTEKYGDDS